MEDYGTHLLLRLISFLFPPQATTDFVLSNIQTILVVRQHDQLGDMLCAVPLLRTLHEKYPSARIVLVASPVNYHIMLENPFVDRVILYNKKNFLRSPISFFRFIREVREERSNIAIVPATVSMSVTSDLIALLSGAAIRIGPRSLEGNQNPAAECFTLKVDLQWLTDKRRHQTKRNLDIVRTLGVESDYLECRIGLTNEERATASSILKPIRKHCRTLIGIHPGAGKAQNRWSPERFASVVNRVAKEHNAGIIITAGPMDNEPLQELLKLLSCTYELVRNKPIRIVAALLDQLDLFITNDTGVMHIAGAVRTHVLALFGPTDPLQWAPVGQKNRYIAAPDGNIHSITTEDVNNVIDIILSDIPRQRTPD